MVESKAINCSACNRVVMSDHVDRAGLCVYCRPAETEKQKRDPSPTAQTPFTAGSEV